MKYPGLLPKSYHKSLPCSIGPGALSICGLILYNLDMLRNERDSGPGSDGLPRGRFAIMAIGGTLLLVAVASFLPGVRLWGLNHLAFYPVPVRIVAIAAVGLCMLPAVGGAVFSVFLRVFTCLQINRRLRTSAVALISAASIGVFWGLRSSTLLLGDARLVSNNFEHAFQPGYEVVVRSPRIIMLHEPISKGTSLLYHFAVRAWLQVFGASPVDGIRFLNCLLGGLFIFILLRRVLKQDVPGLLAIWAPAMVLASGAMVLYFGYVENYTPLIFFGSMYVMKALDSIGPGRRRMLPAVTLFLALSVFMHVQGILLIPSFVLLLIWHSGGWLRKRLGVVSAALVLLIAIAAVAVAAYTPLGTHILPLLADQETYGLLSPSHLADMANELFLILPLILVVAALALEAPGRPSGRAPEEQASMHFIRLILVPCLIFLFCFRPDLGMARDWDLFSITALGLVPLALLVTGRGAREGNSRCLNSIGVPALALGAVLALAWVGINASPDLSAGRFNAILRYDRTRAQYAYEVLAQHFRNRGDMAGAITALEEAASVSFNARIMALVADFYEEKGDLEKATSLRYEVLERQPMYEGARRDLVLTLHKHNRYAEILDVAREGTRYHPESPVYHYFYGLALIEAGHVESGIEELLICRRLDPGSQALEIIEQVLAGLKARGWDVEPEDSETRFSLPDR